MTTPDYTVSLPLFEGPLDLLLHLVKKHELDVMDIPVSFITEKYLEYLDLMRKLNLDVAGEYLLMAATLVHLKSRELVPTKDPLEADPDAEEEELDPRQELIRRLLEYQKYKEAAAALDGRPVVGRNVWTRGAVLDNDDPDAAPLAEVPVFKLLEALADVLAKARVRIAHEVIVDRLSITDRINELVDRLAAEGSFAFRSCFQWDDEVTAAQLKHDVVVTFLAILEMTRLRMVRIEQAAGGGEIMIMRVRGESIVSETESEKRKREVRAQATADPAAPSDDEAAAELEAVESDEAVAEKDATPPAGEGHEVPERLKSIIESLLFASDKPLPVKKLVELTGERDIENVPAAVEALRADYADRGVVLHEVAGGFQFRTNPMNAHWVRQLLAGKPVKLSRAQLEVLSIIAYRQPITRPEVDDIRGVDSGATIKGLLDRQLIRVLGKKEEPGRPMLYGTTRDFLEFFNLKDLKDLPTLREFYELSEESMAKIRELDETRAAEAQQKGGGAEGATEAS